MIYNHQPIKQAYIIIYIVLLGLSSCSIYSFSGASIPEDAKTIYIDYIQNDASLIEPNLSNKLTESLKTKCLNESQLIWENKNPNIRFSGKIKKYELSPIAIQNNETAAQNRLTISVEITYVNKVDNSQDFNQLFTEYTDFDSNKNFYEEEAELNELIINNLVENIFNAAFLNW